MFQQCCDIGTNGIIRQMKKLRLSDLLKVLVSKHESVVELIFQTSRPEIMYALGHATSLFFGKQ